jgi:2-haloacid dehalogenase
MRAVIFDAYGTLFDVHSVVLRDGHNITGDVQTLSTLWRQRQLEYTWLRSLMGRYEDFWSVTRVALRSAARQLQFEANEAQLDNLMQAYLSPSAFPDVKPALESLKGLPLAILSNGSPKMLESAVRHNGLESSFAGIISVDRVRTYKPSPRVYALGTEILRLPAAEILFVSSNWWDAGGAKAFGYKVCWCSRSKAEMAAKIEFLDGAPDFTVTRLDQIVDHLQE